MIHGSLKKCFKEWIIIQLGRSLQKTLMFYHQVPEAKIFFEKQSSIGAFKQSDPKTQGNTWKQNPRWRAKSEPSLPVTLTICEMHLWMICELFVKNLWNDLWMKCICEMHEEITRNLNLNYVYFQFLKKITFHLHLLCIY